MSPQIQVKPELMQVFDVRTGKESMAYCLEVNLSELKFEFESQAEAVADAIMDAIKKAKTAH